MTGLEVSAIELTDQERQRTLDELEKRYAELENERQYIVWRMDLITEEIHRIQKEKI